MNNSHGSLRPHLFDLADKDRQCLARIRERLQLNSNALAVRLAIRSLAKRLSDPEAQTTQEGEHNVGSL